MDAIDFETLILTEVVECLAEHAIDYIIDQVAAAYDDRSDEDEESVLAVDAETAGRFGTWEEFIGLGACHEWVTGETWPHGGRVPGPPRP